MWNPRWRSLQFVLCSWTKHSYNDLDHHHLWPKAPARMFAPGMWMLTAASTSPMLLRIPRPASNLRPRLAQMAKWKEDSICSTPRLSHSSAGLASSKTDDAIGLTLAEWPLRRVNDLLASNVSQYPRLPLPYFNVHQWTNFWVVEIFWGILSPVVTAGFSFAELLAADCFLSRRWAKFWTQWPRAHGQVWWCTTSWSNPMGRIE